MSYIFPKRAMGKSDLLDPEDMNADTTTVADLAGGQLNEHNFNERMKTAATVEDGAYHTPHYVVRRVDPGLPDAHTTTDQCHSRPSAYKATARLGDSGPWWVPDDQQWHTIAAGETNAMKIVTTTGSAKLWLAGWLQYFWLPDVNEISKPLATTEWMLTGTLGISRIETGGWVGERLGGGTFTGNYAANVRFALRVDGRIVDHTVTGSLEKKPRPAPFTPKNPVAAERGAVRPVSEAHSQNPAASAVRNGCIVEVGPGEHTIELVARRVKPVRRANRPNQFLDEGTGKPADDIIAVYSSQLMAIEIPETPSATASGNDILVETFTAEDSLTTEAMYNERMDKIKDGYNSLKGDNLARGALNHNHLPGPVLEARTTESSSEGTVTSAFPRFQHHSTSIIPDYGTGPGPSGIVHDHETVIGAYTAGGTVGWTPIERLEVGDPTTGLDVHSEKCFLVVMGNVQLKRISKENTDNDNDVLACLGLGYQLVDPADGTVTPSDMTPGYPAHFMISESIGFFNNSNMNRWADATGHEGLKVEDNDVHIDVPLLWVADMTDRDATPGRYGTNSTKPPLSAAGSLRNFKNFQIFASVHPKGRDKNHLASGGTYIPSGTEDAKIEVHRSNLSVFLLRY